MSRHKVLNLTDRQAECEFERWASCLNEVIVMQIYSMTHPKCGQLIGLNDIVQDGDTVDEVKTVYEWGVELAELERKALHTGSYELYRMHCIVMMFGDAGLIWRGGPCWWRQL
jgi:hypothetical protein